MLFRPGKCSLNHCHVQGHRFFLALEMKIKGKPDLFHLNPQHIGQHTHVSHIGNVVAQSSRSLRFFGEPLRRKGINGDILAINIKFEMVRIVEGAPRDNLFQILTKGIHIHGDNYFMCIAARRIAVFAQPNGVPGGQTLNI